MTDKNKPAHKIRSGALTVTIWKNESDKGTFYSVVPSRSYKQGDTWHESNSYGQDELLRLGKLLDQADTWIVQEQAKAKAAGQAQDADQSYIEQETTRKQAGGRER